MREAARREAAEETGLEVEVGDIVWVGEVIEETHHLVLVDFEAVAVEGTLTPGDDADEAKWVGRDQLDSYRLTPTMYDLISTLTP